MINAVDALTKEQKIKILNGRLLQFTEEAYQQQLNLKTAEALGVKEQVKTAQNALKALETAIQVHQEELKVVAES